MNTVTDVATVADKVLKDFMKVEPTIVGVSSMFIPGAGPVLAMVQPWVLTAVPFIERALDDIAAGNGNDLFGAFIELMQHVKKGGPNSVTLSAPETGGSNGA